MVKQLKTETHQEIVYLDSNGQQTSRWSII